MNNFALQNSEKEHRTECQKKKNNKCGSSLTFLWQIQGLNNARY